MARTNLAFAIIITTAAPIPIKAAPEFADEKSLSQPSTRQNDAYWMYACTKMMKEKEPEWPGYEISQHCSDTDPGFPRVPPARMGRDEYIFYCMQDKNRKDEESKCIDAEKSRH